MYNNTIWRFQILGGILCHFVLFSMFLRWLSLHPGRTYMYAKVMVQKISTLSSSTPKFGIHAYLHACLPACMQACMPACMSEPAYLSLHACVRARGWVGGWAGASGQVCVIQPNYGLNGCRCASSRREDGGCNHC